MGDRKLPLLMWEETETDSMRDGKEECNKKWFPEQC
jgi:hypothetical protein